MNMENPNRRKVLGILAGAALSPLAESLEAHAKGAEILPSLLTPEAIEKDKNIAAEKLIQPLWTTDAAREFAIKSYFNGSRDREEIKRRLLLESRMSIPSESDTRALSEKYQAKLEELGNSMHEGTFGIFVDGDTQTVHLMQKEAGRLRSIKAYATSTSNLPWSNVQNSRGTPLGLHRIATGRMGLLGEVMTMTDRKPSHYTFVPIRNKNAVRKLPFIKRFGAHTDTGADIITAAYMLVGPQTPTERGIFIHGTNYPELLGRRASGGCLRLSSVDVQDLSQYLKIGSLKGDREAPHGTPVMIEATQGMPVPGEPVTIKDRNLFEKIDASKSPAKPEMSTPSAPAVQPSQPKPARRNLFDEL